MMDNGASPRGDLLASSNPAQVDQQLAALGGIPADLDRLLIQYAGADRLSVSRADELLHSLFLHAPLRAVSHALVPELPEPVMRTPEFAVSDWGGDAATYGAAHAPELRTFAAPPAPEFDTGDTDHGLGNALPPPPPSRDVYGALDELAAASAADATDDSRSSSEFGAGLFTHRMDASELRRSSVPAAARHTPFSSFPDGPPGSQELTEYQQGRAGNGSRPAAADSFAPTTPPQSSQSLHDPDEDSFEILVDEEIFELEPDDVLDDS
jgi:hypothetical protein